MSDSDEDLFSKITFAADGGNGSDDSPNEREQQEQQKLIHVEHAAARITLSVNAAPGSFDRS